MPRPWPTRPANQATQRLWANKWLSAAQKAGRLVQTTSRCQSSTSANCYSSRWEHCKVHRLRQDQLKMDKNHEAPSPQIWRFLTKKNNTWILRIWPSLAKIAKSPEDASKLPTKQAVIRPAWAGKKFPWPGAVQVRPKLRNWISAPHHLSKPASPTHSCCMYCTVCIVLYCIVLLKYLNPPVFLKINLRSGT